MALNAQEIFNRVSKLFLQYQYINNGYDILPSNKRYSFIICAKLIPEEEIEPGMEDVTNPHKFMEKYKTKKSVKQLIKNEKLIERLSFFALKKEIWKSENLLKKELQRLAENFKLKTEVLDEPLIE